MKIRVYGPGCANCKRLEEHTRKALVGLGQEADVAKIEDLSEIAAAGVMRTPALEVNGELLLQGRVPGVRELTSIINRALAAS